MICTLGPATRMPETIRDMIEAGMDFARLNFSHGNELFHKETTHVVRDMARQAGREVKILQDLQGPKLRIGDLGHPLHFRSGDKTALTDSATEPDDIPVADPQILTWIRAGDRIFLDDGVVELEALNIQEKRIECAVRVGGRLDSRSGLALPGRRIVFPTLSTKDIADIKLGQQLRVDIVAQSMVRNRADVDRLKEYLNRDTPTIAKIESAEALQDLDRIAEGVWGIMVARGDLGVSIPRAQVPMWQKEILQICRKQRCFGIVATEMLLSMVKNDRPTRAEVSDVATAVLDGARAVMLSEETAIGAHPVRAIREMVEIIETVEASRWYHAEEP